MCISAAPVSGIQEIAEAAAPMCKSDCVSTCHHTMINRRTSRLAHTEASPPTPHRRLGQPPRATLRAPSTGTCGRPAWPPPQTRHPSIARRHRLLQARLDLDELARPTPRHPPRRRANLDERGRRWDHRQRRRRHVQGRPTRGGGRRPAGRRDRRRRRRRRRWQGYQPPGSSWVTTCRPSPCACRSCPCPCPTCSCPLFASPPCAFP